VQLAQRIVKRDQPQQQIVSTRAELARLHDPRDRRFHVKNKCPRTATHIRDDRRDCVLRRAEIVETRSRVAVVTIGQDHLIQSYVIDYWHLSGSFRYARNSVVVESCIPRLVISFMKFCACVSNPGMSLDASVSSTSLEMYESSPKLLAISRTVLARQCVRASPAMTTTSAFSNV